MVDFRTPYPQELLELATRRVWYKTPDEALGRSKAFVAHIMAYGNQSDLAILERYVGEAAFREVLDDAPPGLFDRDKWNAWHRRFGLNERPLPRRQFPDGTMGAEPGDFCGR